MTWQEHTAMKIYDFVNAKLPNLQVYIFKTAIKKIKKYKSNKLKKQYS